MGPKMSSKFTVPSLAPAQIVEVLKLSGIADVRPEDLSKPTADLVFSIYSGLLAFIDAPSNDPDAQVDFNELLLQGENPEHLAEAFRIYNLYHKVKEIITAIRYDGFTLRDILKPEPKRTYKILEHIVNFVYYRVEKLEKLNVADDFSVLEEQKMELTEKIEALNKEIAEHEAARQLEEPLVQEVDAEVKELKQTIQNYNKQQVSLKAMAKGLKEKSDAIKDKISQADFELMKIATENSKLQSKIVQSPEKLQRTLEEKKANRANVKNFERLAMQSVQEKTATLEVYSKAYEKMSKHLSQVQALQEQVNSAKGVDKDVKALKAKLSDEEFSKRSLEAKIVERQGKAKQAEELIKAAEKERDVRHAEDTQRLNSARTELEWKLQGLELRERKAEAMVAKGDALHSEAKLVREAGWVKQQQLQAKHEEIVLKFHNYSNSVGSVIERVETEIGKELLGSGNNV